MLFSRTCLYNPIPSNNVFNFDSVAGAGTKWFIRVRLPEFRFKTETERQSACESASIKRGFPSIERESANFKRESVRSGWPKGKFGYES